MKRFIANITNKCNFSCQTCLRGYARGTDLDISIFEEIIPEIKKMNCQLVAITGGEPILHSNFKDVLEIIASAGMSFSLVSNGFLWEKYLPLFKKHKQNLSHITLSIDGSNAQIHDRIRQKGSFDRVLEAAENFEKEGIEVFFSTCLNKINKDDQENIIALARKLKASFHNFTATLETESNRGIIMEEKEREDCLAIIKNSRNASSIPIKACSSLARSKDVSFCRELNLDSLMVNPFGEIAFCCDTTKNGAIVGSLKEKSFLKLYLKALDMANEIKKARAKILVSGDIPEGFYDCRFCNNFLAKYIG